MIYGGEEITLSKGETVKDILNRIDDDKNYFYILQLPRCGDNRIKIGKSKKIHKRFSEYANLFYGSVVYVLKLVVFPNKNIGDNAKKPAEIFESMMKSKLKKVQGKTNVLGREIQTEWYDYKYKNDVLAMYELLKNGDEDDETEKRKSQRLKIGDQIKVLWNLEKSRKKQYYSGKVLKVGKNDYTVKYDEDDSIHTHTYNVKWDFDD